MEENLHFKERLALTLVLGLILFFITIDVYTDFGRGVSLAHVAIELLVALTTLVGIVLVWWKILTLQKRVSTLHLDLEKARKIADQWKSENEELLKGLGEAIDRQFGKWKLSDAEKEVALLMLKGLSFKEIAEARQTSERTVRHQSLAVYSKSGLSGRTELAAFFLEDLLLPWQKKPTQKTL